MVEQLPSGVGNGMGIVAVVLQNYFSNYLSRGVGPQNENQGTGSAGGSVLARPTHPCGVLTAQTVGEDQENEGDLGASA